MASAALTGSQDWQASSETLMHGLIYFTMLGLLELSGVYDLEWKRLFRNRAASPDAGA